MWDTRSDPLLVTLALHVDLRDSCTFYLPHQRPLDMLGVRTPPRCDRVAGIHQRVCVCATVAESADPDIARIASHGGTLSQNQGRPIIDVQVRVQDRQVLIRSTLGMHASHHALTQRTHARAALKMPQVCFGTRDHQRVLSVRQDLPHGSDFNRIAQRGPSTVRLVNTDLLRLHLCLGQDRPQQALLRRAVGGRETGAAAIAVGVAASE
mmetsp:Transcript_55633/g.141051  ORF Transcript_55633/g.141051 Transcript_55633/m.141051 type:complete len:209 (+) Transcript_55633:542-1168(+)